MPMRGTGKAVAAAELRSWIAREGQSITVGWLPGHLNFSFDTQQTIRCDAMAWSEALSRHSGVEGFQMALRGQSKRIRLR
jgi:hypothetical protein